MCKDWRQAEEADLNRIEAWLRQEWEETQRGAYCNWDLMRRSYRNAGLHVLTAGDLPVAFLADEGAIHVLAVVHPDHRGKGHGGSIANRMMYLSRARGISVEEISCAPQSEPFWRRMGFNIVEDRAGDFGGVYAYREVPYTFKLAHGPRGEVEIKFYSPCAPCEGTVSPFQEYRVYTSRNQDGSLQLHRRAVCFHPAIRDLYDSIVEIWVDGQLLLRDKVKSDSARDLGVEQDPAGIYYIDRVVPCGGIAEDVRPALSKAAR